ncbi:unnamed protein product [Rotaria sp. Silwood1]|nr:unnamed protein product [Rotaria sp. Silwood1]
MKYLLYILLFFGSKFLESIQGQCSGGIWPIQDTTIGSFTVSWRYNMASNTVQFIIQGQATASVNLASTYIAIGWSDTAPTMNNMDVAMFFPGTQIVQDRYSQGHVVPLIDTQQDFCVIRTNITDNKNIYVAFERFLTTGDVHDITFTPNLYLMFSMGPYVLSNGTNTFIPQYHFFRIPLRTSLSLMNCVSNNCFTTSCTIPSCPCLQQIISDLAQCICFPPSSCISGSTITPKPTTSTLATTSLTLPLSGILNGSCQNQANLCSVNGICLQTSTTQYICQCKNNYTGVLCQIPLFSNNSTNTNSCQCVNGGICLTNGTCLCTNLYRGKFCQLNNPCIDYCQNNNTCSVICTDTSCSLPYCTCKNSYTGIRCETIVGGLCQSNSCIYGNCVILTNGSFQCQCNFGFFGSRCEFINSCLSNPCNQGACIVSLNCLGLLCSYSCLCPNGTTGQNCEIGGNPCLSTPCKNNGNCSALSNSYSCRCLLPYGGTNCELMINVCTPNPCLNNGICVRSSNIKDGTYQCNCQNGYVGTRCEYVSGCISSPCQNAGQCVSSTTNCSSTTCSISCICLSGTTGVFCEQQDTSCLIFPCLNGGTCLKNPITNIYYCQCRSNTIGARCETIQSICTNTACLNNGVCYIDATSGSNTLGCVCRPGSTGRYCQTYINSCSQSPCGYNGTCFPTSNSSYYCICPNGLLDTLMSCSDSPCHYLSTCQQISNTNSINYKCICPDYLTGDRCQYTNNCQKKPCYNQGSCISLGSQNNFMCLCQPGYGHYDCSIYLGLSCNSNVCLNGGTCDYNNTNIRCICPTGFAGTRCEWNSVCSTNTCLNGGTCRQIAATMAECLCAVGFTGPTCNLRDSCANFPCKNGAGCKTLLTDAGTNWSVYLCVCPPGFYGQNCDTAIGSCANVLCPSYKICNEQSTGPVCTCPGNQVGTFCQYENPCTVSSSSYCFNGGTCVSSNTDPPIAVCLCREGFIGSYCNMTRQNELCASNPCQTHGYCALSTSNTSYSCICQSNYVGDQCERANPCLSSPCLNQGICQGYWNTTSAWFICLCVGPFTGIKCETSLLNPCGGLCMNRSPCVNGVCVCSAQYTGTFCGFDNPCYNQICRNNGFCSTNFNSTSVSFTCTCRSYFTGQYCETSIYAQSTPTSCASTCYNSGSCVNGLCMCTSQYVGPSCQYENPCISHNPCLNGSTCFGQYNTNGSVYTQCFCPQGYTGIYCEATLCSSTSCNGGLCTATQNSIVCVCQIGQVGDRCQYPDACANNPCSPSDRCVQTENQYRCISCYDKSSFCSIYQNHSEYCLNRYTILVDDTWLPVPEACRRSCNQCVPIKQSNDRRSLDEQEYVPENMTTTLSSTMTIEISRLNIIFSREEKCFDKRDDCLMQKACGFCVIFNEKYPNDCVKTCHPDCAFLS